MFATIIWAIVVLAVAMLVCNTAKDIVDTTHPVHHDELKPLPEVDENGERIPSFDDIIATIYGREDEHE